MKYKFNLNKTKIVIDFGISFFQFAHLDARQYYLLFIHFYTVSTL
jgi:hypothetical protein